MDQVVLIVKNKFTVFSQLYAVISDGEVEHFLHPQVGLEFGLCRGYLWSLNEGSNPDAGLVKRPQVFVSDIFVVPQACLVCKIVINDNLISYCHHKILT